MNILLKRHIFYECFFAWEVVLIGLYNGGGGGGGLWTLMYAGQSPPVSGLLGNHLLDFFLEITVVGILKSTFGGTKFYKNLSAGLC